MKSSNKLIIVCGPTATGKTDLGLKLAEKFNGEIISADSRQVYIGMNIGTGKDIPKNLQFTIYNLQLPEFNNKFQFGYYLINNIKVWGLDIVKPDYPFNVGEFKQIAIKIIDDIINRGKIPIIVGGTGLYIKSLIEPLSNVSVPPNSKLREKLKDFSVLELKKELEKIDRNKFSTMNNSDIKNPRRLIRAIEIAEYLNHHRQFHYDTVQYHSDRNKILLIGLNGSLEYIFQNISARIQKRLKQGIIEEIKNLLSNGYGWDLASMSGFSYMEFRPYFEKREKIDEVIKKWQINEQNLVKKQMTWFKKIPDIRWFDTENIGFYTEIENVVCKFLKEP